MKSVYLVLDMQNDLVSEDGPNGKSPLGVQVKERGILDKTAKANGIFKLGTSGTEIHSKLGKQDSDWLVTKHRVSPFYSTDLETYLRVSGIERIFCSGGSTQAVVQATVRDGHDRDYAMVVLEDCCAAHSAEEHKSSIGSLGRFCTVTTSGQVDFG